MDETRSESSESALIERARHRDVDAFAALVRLHHPGVRVFLGNHVRDRAALDDLVQDVFLRAFDRLGTLREATAFRSWLLGIARNRALEHLRERVRSARPLDDALELLLARSQIATLEGDDEDQQRALELEALERCMRRLPTNGARLIRDYYFKGRSIADLASEQRKNEGAVRMMLLRLREALRECVRNHLPAAGES
jgi:RNA polymerase sigma-70 factor (ECF subfamily)